MEVAALMEQTQAAAADPTWLGSEAHRALIEAFAASRAPGVRVVWLQPGKASYNEGQTIAIERPGSDEDETVREARNLVVFHEVLHQVHSDSDRAAAFVARLASFPPYLQQLGQALFNHLEDARVARREHGQAPENDPHVERLHRLSLEQAEASYFGEFNESPWTTTPAHKIAQLRMALIARILAGEAELGYLHPLVAEVLDAAEPLIAEAVGARATQGAREGALQLITLVGRRLSELAATE